MADTSWIVNPMLAERNRLAKALNKRIRTLEKAGIDFGAIVQYKDYIEEYYGTSRYGKLRFPERRTAASSASWKVNRSLRAELDILEYFWNQPNVPEDRKWKTVTVKGARELMEKTRQNFAAMGLHFNDDKLMREFLESESWKSLKKIYGSKLAIRLAGTRRFTHGNERRASTVEAMDRRLAQFIKRQGKNYDLRNMSAEDVQKVFGISSQNIVDLISDADDLPL